MKESPRKHQKAERRKIGRKDKKIQRLFWLAGIPKTREDMKKTGRNYQEIIKDPRSEVQEMTLQNLESTIHTEDWVSKQHDLYNEFFKVHTKHTIEI